MAGDLLNGKVTTTNKAITSQCEIHIFPSKQVLGPVFHVEDILKGVDGGRWLMAGDLLNEKVTTTNKAVASQCEIHIFPNKQVLAPVFHVEDILKGVDEGCSPG